MGTFLKREQFHGTCWAGDRARPCSCLLSGEPEPFTIPSCKQTNAMWEWVVKAARLLPDVPCLLRCLKVACPSFERIRKEIGVSAYYDVPIPTDMGGITENIHKRDMHHTYAVWICRSKRGRSRYQRYKGEMRESWRSWISVTCLLCLSHILA